MNYLILGGNGYLGSKVTKRLIHEGHSITCTRRPESDLSRLKCVENNIRWISTSLDEIDMVMQDTQFDYVLNMACNYGKCATSYNDIIEANLVFPLRVLDISVSHGITKFLAIGTGLPESFNMYSFSKKKLSDFGKYYVEKLGITFINLLLEMFYGPDEPGDRFFPSIIKKMIRGELVETTKGTQHRDIISIEDVVNAVIMVLNSGLDGFWSIPVGTGECPALTEVVDFIWEKTGRKSRVLKGVVPMRKMEPNCVADLDIIKSIGPWQPKPWKIGLSTMIEAMMIDDN